MVRGGGGGGGCVQTWPLDGPPAPKSRSLLEMGWRGDSSTPGEAFWGPAKYGVPVGDATTHEHRWWVVAG